MGEAQRKAAGGRGGREEDVILTRWGMLHVSGPYREWTARRRRRIAEAVAFGIAIAILAAAVFLFAFTVVDVMTRPETVQATGWFTQEEARRMARFHGTSVVKVTDNYVAIRRDGRWIVVLRREGGVVR